MQDDKNKTSHFEEYHRRENGLPSKQPGAFEQVADNLTKDKSKTKREILDAAYARGEFLPGEFNSTVPLSNDFVLEEIKKHDDVKYNKHTGKFEDESGRTYTAAEAAKQNYLNFKRHKKAGFKKVKNANNRSRDLLEEQRKYLGYGKPITLFDSTPKNPEPVEQPEYEQMDIEEYIKRKAAEKIKKEDEELRNKFGTKGIASLGDWNI